MSAQERGEIIPFERPETNRAEVEEAVKLWRRSHDTADILSREEIGAMDFKRRMDAQRKALLLALSEYYHKHERADVAPGVLAIITIMSDNDKGCATISQPSLALFLGRSESSIRDAQKRLKDDGLITMTRGRFAGSSPVIPSFVADQYNHMTWLIGAVNDDVKKPLNLPAPPADCQSGRPPGGLTESAYGTGGMKSVNPPVEDISIRRGDARQLLTKNSTTLNKAASVVAAGIATAMGSLPAAAAPPQPLAVEQPARLSLAQMTEQMITAAGPALANPAAQPGLLTYGELQRWLAAGCDFEGDILPAIKSRACRAKPGSLRSWSYFADAVADQKAIRERPMPEARGHQFRSSAGTDSPFKERSLLSDDGPPRKLRPRCEVET